MPTHTTLDGRRIDLGGCPAVVLAFIDRVATLASDPSVGLSELIDVLDDPANPVLVPGVIPGRGRVTGAALADPAFQVMQDLEHRKRRELRRPAPDRARVSIAEAARRLGTPEGVGMLGGGWVHAVPIDVDR